MKQLRKKYLIDKKFQIKHIFYLVSVLVATVVIISAIVYITTWVSVIKEFSDVKLHQDLTTIVRMREYEGVRTKTIVETIPILKEEAKMLSKHQLEVINKILIKTNIRVFIVMIFLILFVVVSGIFITHRIAGPLFRINRELDKLIEGDLDVNFTLRRKDELKPLSSKLQTLVNKLKSNRQQLKESIEELKNTHLDENQKKILKNIEKILE